MVKYLLEKAAASVSERNADGMLPIHLFCDFVREQMGEEENPQQLEIIWCLLMAYPETVLNNW